MALGAAATAPRGFVEFCERQPGDCGASPAELASLKLQGGANASTAAIQYDWSAVFAANGISLQASVGARSDVAAVGYDRAQELVRSPQPSGSAAPLKQLVSASPAAPARAATGQLMTPSLWTLINKTNESVNRAIIQKTDIEAYGVDELWSTPIETGGKYGDCEDFVLEKRRALLAAGMPREALSIAVVSTFRGETHAVLLVATSQGEYVLDSLTPWVLPWTQTPYQWRERQVAGSASHWALAAGRPVQTAPSHLLLASAQ